MIRSVLVAVPLAFLLLAGVRAEEVKADPQEVSRGGHSQQYHYQSYPGHDGHTYAGLSFDLSTGLFLAIGAIIVLLSLAAVCYPLLGKGGGDYGWSGSQYGTYRSVNVANLSEKVLSGIEKLYEVYNKNQ